MSVAIWFKPGSSLAQAEALGRAGALPSCPRTSLLGRGDAVPAVEEAFTFRTQVRRLPCVGPCE
eukprot:6182965-Heterocapsa_arctica.AAC.1